MNKPFKTYEQLIQKLEKEKKLLIPDKTYAIRLLKEHSYFALISGYKEPFKDKITGFYKSGTKIDDIFALYIYDSNLRGIVLENTLIIEKHIKSLLSYAFAEVYGDEQSQYLNPNNYDCMTSKKDDRTKKREIKNLISMFTNVVIPPFEHKYIEHQWTNYKNVPLWVSIKELTFGSVSKMYSLCPQKIQAKVSIEFPDVNAGQLSSMLALLSKVRNVCAHNERLYDYSTGEKRSIPNMPIHSKLKIPVDGAEYKKGKSDLFAAVICFKYLLSKEQFISAVNQIDKEIKTLCNSTNRVEEKQMFKYMGFPSNWLEILKC